MKSRYSDCNSTGFLACMEIFFEKNQKMAQNTSSFYIQGKTRKKSDISIVATQVTWISVLPMSKGGSSGREARHTVNKEQIGRRPGGRPT